MLQPHVIEAVTVCTCAATLMVQAFAEDPTNKAEVAEEARRNAMRGVSGNCRHSNLSPPATNPDPDLNPNPNFNPSPNPNPDQAYPSSASTASTRAPARSRRPCCWR
eukprot:scaffold613_cov79-Phaeocystis_antarctica.AAC.14